MSSAVTETTGEAVAAAGLRVMVPVTMIASPASAPVGVAAAVAAGAAGASDSSCEVAPGAFVGSCTVVVASCAYAGPAIATPAMMVVARSDPLPVNFIIFPSIRRLPERQNELNPRHNERTDWRLGMKK